MRTPGSFPTNILFIAGMLVWLAAHAQRTAAQVARIPSHDEQQTAKRYIHSDALRAYIQFLSDDLLEGRGPGSRGDRLAERYLMTQLSSFGLQPAAADGSWLQPVPLVGFRTLAPESITLSAREKQLSLNRVEDFVFSLGSPVESARIDDAELVFVGYGMVAPEYDWNDYKDVDLQGKILVMMNNDPADDPALFEGKRRLYYGRWDYKYEIAARQGAAGAIIIHTTASAGYPYQVVQTSWTGEEFALRDAASQRPTLCGWFQEDAARRVIQLAGQDLDELRNAAERRDFRPVPLAVRLSVQLTSQSRQQETANVLGKLVGSDPELQDEYVVFTAHHDHLGQAETPDSTGDRIYNGAVDNASGAAALLAIARAFSELPQAPGRSIMFAFVGAEEQGLLGSQFLAAHPPIPPDNMAAAINIDGVNIFGRTRDVNLIGMGKSSLDETVKRMAAWQDRFVTPDQFPDKGFFYRSDQFSLAKIGVPAVYLHPGIQVVGKADDYGRQQREAWIEKYYHQTSDEYDAGWDLAGAVEDAQLLFHVAVDTANAGETPHWNPGDEFEKARQR